MMWNYNLDEMPKDGSEIVVCVKFKNYDGNELTMFYTIKFVFGFWQNYPSQTKWKHMDKVFCWALAPKDPESDSETNKLKYTNRGFEYYKFSDYNRNECSLQKSSLIADEYCVWLGRDKNQGPHHITGQEMSPRMHLTQSQAKWLGKKLIKFAETGELN